MAGLYSVILEEKIPKLVKEREIEYSKMDSQTKVINIMNNVFNLGQRAEEYLYLISLDNKLNICGIFEVSHGTSNGSYCDMKSIMTRALLSGASGIILVHNHPSGETTPSGDDINITRKLDEASKFMDIELLDHVVMGGNHYYSMKENGII